MTARDGAAGAPYNPRHRRLDEPPQRVPHAPASSWWLDAATRESFAAAHAREAARQRHNHHGKRLTGRDVLPRRGRR